VVNFDIPDDSVVERLSGRLVCRQCGHNFHAKFQPPEKPGRCDACGGEVYTREDDRPQAVQKRLEVYRAQTAPLTDFYRKRGILLDIDARPSPEEVGENFRKALGI
jgi:adenylate kinase